MLFIKPKLFSVVKDPVWALFIKSIDIPACMSLVDPRLVSILRVSSLLVISYLLFCNNEKVLRVHSYTSGSKSASITFSSAMGIKTSL